MTWVMLFLAAAMEIVMGVMLKLNQGWTRPIPSGMAIAAGMASIYLLARSLSSLPLGTAYAIWTGIGTIGLTVIGILLFHESMAWTRLLFLGLALVGIIGLRFSGSPA
jgi:quaternary ammonium compound-resistance protein SugE